MNAYQLYAWRLTKRLIVVLMFATLLPMLVVMVLDAVLYVFTGRTYVITELIMEWPAK